MSDGGGGESSRGIESSKRRRRRRNDEFAQSIARIAVAQVCESVGFQGFQQSALDTFSDIVCKYIREIGKTSHFYANLAGRTESNVLDIVQGLEDLGLSQGFVGASDIDHCLTGSGIIKEISQYVGVSEEVGFAYSIPPFPVVKELDLAPSFMQVGDTPPTDDIPPWLPRFPDPKTYTCLPSTSLEETELKPDRVEQEQKVIEPSSMKVEQRLACNGSELSMAVEHGDNARRERTNNPFLALPLQYGEKEVSSVSLPAKLVEDDVAQNHSLWANHISALETFAPAIEALKSNDRDIEEGGRNILLNSRPQVQLKFSMDKKPLDTSNRHNKQGNAEAMCWFVNDEVKDDKKRRAEKILRESMDTGDHTENDSVVN